MKNNKTRIILAVIFFFFFIACIPLQLNAQIGYSGQFRAGFGLLTGNQFIHNQFNQMQAKIEDNGFSVTEASAQNNIKKMVYLELIFKTSIFQNLGIGISTGTFIIIDPHNIKYKINVSDKNYGLISSIPLIFPISAIIYYKFNINNLWSLCFIMGPGYGLNYSKYTMNCSSNASIKDYDFNYKHTVVKQNLIVNASCEASYRINSQLSFEFGCQFDTFIEKNTYWESTIYIGITEYSGLL